MRALYFAAGLIAGLYAGAWLLNAWRPVFPDPFPETRTAADGRVWSWQATTPAT